MNTHIDSSKVVGLDYSQQKLYVASDGSDGRSPLGNRTNSNSSWTHGSELRINPRSKLWTDKQRSLWHKENAEKLSALYPVIVIEELDFEEMRRNRPLLAATLENNRPDEFYNMLAKSCKQLITVDRYFASSQICSRCGYRIDFFPLNEQMFFCPKCGNCLDRDLNAAINIKNEGLRLLGAG